MPRNPKLPHGIAEPSLAAPKRKSGVEIIDEMIDAPTLDRFFDNEEEDLTDDDLWKLIDINRRQRAINIDKDND